MQFKSDIGHLSMLRCVFVQTRQNADLLPRTKKATRGLVSQYQLETNSPSVRLLICMHSGSSGARWALVGPGDRPWPALMLRGSPSLVGLDNSRRND